MWGTETMEELKSQSQTEVTARAATHPRFGKGMSLAGIREGAVQREDMLSGPRPAQGQGPWASWLFPPFSFSSLIPLG